MTEIIPGKSKRWHVVFAEAHKQGLSKEEAENKSITEMIDWMGDKKEYNPPLNKESFSII